MAGEPPHESLPHEVAEFLRQFKALLKFHPDKYGWEDRFNRQKELAELDAAMTFSKAEEIIRDQLEPKHYHKGPEPDDHFPETGVVFIFCCQIPDCPDAYVKLALRSIANKRNQFRGVIWSFKKWSSDKEGARP